ncbi:MAG: CPXCG motif-containing cysteine-rich protein [Salinivenus sp.]
MHLIDQSVTCPYCWETISLSVDPSVREQTYIEDCQVCCRPIQVHVVTEGTRVVSFDAQPAQ